MVNKPGSAARGKAARESAGRLKQLRMVARLVHRTNPRALPLCAAAAIGTIAVFVVIGVLTGLGGLLIPFGVMVGVLSGMILFGRFAQSAQYKAIEGQPGAAAAVLQSMRGNWTVTPAIAANRNLDVVHRAVGRPGVVLVGEGAPARLGPLLAAEKRRVSRIAYEVPIYDFQVGDDAGQTSIRQLQRKIMKLPRNLKGTAVADLNQRLNALAPTIQAPKGPIPRAPRMPKMPRPRIRLLLIGNELTRTTQVRITTVFAALSCRPRRSRSKTSGGMTASRSRVRSADQNNPTGRPSSRATRMRSRRLPRVKPVSAVST